jgi:hypothetical protein
MSQSAPLRQNPQDMSDKVAVAEDAPEDWVRRWFILKHRCIPCARDVTFRLLHCPMHTCDTGVRNIATGHNVRRYTT